MNKNNELTRQDKARQWRLVNNDCIKVMSKMGDGSVNLTLTDIPYDEVNMNSNGLRNLDKGKADIITFDLDNFLEEVYRITKGTIIIFCGKGQFSQIFNFFKKKQRKMAVQLDN